MKSYELCKTDHDSDCAVYNEPAIPKGNCNCGLIPRFGDYLVGYMHSRGQFHHEGEAQGIAHGFQAGFNCKGILGDDIEFLLDEFKGIESENFDKFGKKYAGTPISANTAELMRHLIFKLEEHIKVIDDVDWAF